MAASSIIGALRVNLALDSAQFQRGASRVGRDVAAMRRQFALVAGAAAAMGAALAAAAMRGARAIDAAAKAARRMDATVTGYRALALAADDAGVSLDTLTNDVQSLNRELANAAQGGGRAEGALRRIGLSLGDLEGADADERLALIADRVKALGLTAGEATLLLRDLGIRNRELALLVLDGGDALRQARTDIQQYGLALSAVDASRIERANDQISRLGVIGQYIGDQLALRLVPQLGAMAQAMTDSLREGGLLRRVLDTLLAAVERLGAYMGTFVALMGARYVAAMALATASTMTFSGALAFLRGAIARTGIGLIAVALGEVVFQTMRASKAVGGFGNLMSLVKDVAVEALQRIGMGWDYVKAMAVAAAQGMQATFLAAIYNVANGFNQLIRTMAEGFNSIFGTNLSARGVPLEGILSVAADAERSAGAAAAAVSDIGAAITAPLASVEALRDAMAGVADETEDAVAPANELGDALEDAGSGGSRAGRAIAEGMEEAEEATEDLGETLESISKSAIDGFISELSTGFENGMQGLRDLLKRTMSDLSAFLLRNSLKVQIEAATSGLSNALGGLMSGMGMMGPWGAIAGIGIGLLGGLLGRRRKSSSSGDDRKAEQLAAERVRLEKELLRLQGRSAELRRMELAEMDPSLRAMQRRIWALEDETEAAEAAAAAAEAIASERRSLEMEYLRLIGDIEALRRMELEEIDETNKALQEQIWAEQDRQDAINETTRAIQDAVRAVTPDNFASLFEYERALALAANGISTANLNTPIATAPIPQTTSPSGDPVVVELQAIRTQQASMLQRMTGLENVVRKWDGDGLPEERTA